MGRIFCTLAAAVLLTTLAASALADWPHFMGPNRDGVSPETNLLDRWPEAGPPERWRVDLGEGFGGAAIRDGRVYLLDREGDERDVLRVFDLESGEELDSYGYERRGRLSVHGSRSTPTVDDELVFTVGGFGDVHAIDRDTLEPVWNMDLNQQYPEGHLRWGFAQSPLVHGDLLILTPTHPGSPGLIAVNKRDGEVVWESEPFGGDYYTSPDLRTVLGTTGVLILSNEVLAFINPDTGETIWTYDGYRNQFPIPSPTVLDDGERIFLTGGYDAGSQMIRVSGSPAAGFSFEELFTLERGAQLHPAIQIDNHLYANINENATLRRDTMSLAGLACINPDTGEIVWRTGEDPNFDRGNVIYADGRLIILDGQSGWLHLANPTPDGYDEVSRTQVFEYERPLNKNVWAPMALADGRLVLRDQQELVCLDLRDAGRASR